MRSYNQVLGVIDGGRECACRDVSRRHCVGGGAPLNFGRRRLRAAGPKNRRGAAARRWRTKFFSKIPEKIPSILKIF